jgi:D-inositol-3-phosphate glycosyltransferase
MGAARPVLVSDLPALTEVVGHHRSGLVVPPGSPMRLAGALLELAEDAGLRERLGKQGREDARCRTWTELARIYDGIYRELSRV